MCAPEPPNKSTRALGCGRDCRPDIVWAEGFGFAGSETSYRVARHPLQDRHGLHCVHIGGGRPVAREGTSLELDERIETWMYPIFRRSNFRDAAATDGATVRRPETTAATKGPLLVRCGASGLSKSLQHFKERSRYATSHRGTQYRASSYGWILVSAACSKRPRTNRSSRSRCTQIFRPLGNGSHSGRTSSTESIRRSGDLFYFPRFAADPTFRPAPDASS